MPRRASGFDGLGNIMNEFSVARNMDECLAALKSATTRDCQWGIMAVWVVEFSCGGYKIIKIFA